MRLDQIADFAFERLLGRLLRRALAALAAGVFLIVAVYHFTVAGSLALETQYGALNSQTIVGAIYTLAALITIFILWATKRRTTPDGKTLASTREMQLIMLVEAVMLGYTLARKREPLR